MTVDASVSLTQKFVDVAVDQLNLTGLFLASTGVGQRHLPGMKRLYQTLQISFEISKQFDAVHPNQTLPYTYSTRVWRRRELAGFSSGTDRVAASEYLEAIVGRWLAAYEHPQANKSHLLKSALWFSENNGSDYRGGLKMLTSLSAAGHLAFSTILYDTLFKFFGLSQRYESLRFLRDCDTQSLSALNRGLSNFDISDEHPENFPETLLEESIQICLRQIDFAKEAGSLEDWWIRVEQAAGLITALGIFHHDRFSKRCSVIVRSVLSGIEEVSADLSALQGMRVLFANNAVPLTFSLDRYSDYASGYKLQFGESEWLPRLLDERLLFPRAIGDIIKDAKEDSFDSISLPQKFRFPGPRLATPLSIALCVDPEHIRTHGFKSEKLDQVVAEIENGGPNDDNIRATARKRLLRESVSFERAHLSMLPNNAIGRTNGIREVLERCPWLPEALNAQALMLALEGQVMTAVELLTYCVLLRPKEPIHWSALSTIAAANGYGDDHRFFGSAGAAIRDLM